MSLGRFVVSLGLDAGKFTDGWTKAEYKSRTSARKVSRDVSQIADSLGSATSALKAFAGAYVGFDAARSFIQAADSVIVLRNKLELATGSQLAAASAQRELFDIAQRSRVSFIDLGGTFAQVARSSGELGLAQSELLTVTEAIGNAMTITGGPAESMNAALVQLGQGMASGVLRGEELNSVMEQTPRLAMAIADGLGIPLGKLREMGQAGELTSSKVVAALKSQSEVLKNEVARSAITAAQSMTQLSNASVKAAGDIDSALGITSKYAGLLRGAANDVTVFGQTIEDSARRGDSGFTQLANGIGALTGRATFGALEIAASLTNKSINLLTAGIFDLDEQVRLMPANLRGTDAALRDINNRLIDSQAEYDALQKRLATSPDNIYIKSELGNLARYITALKEARAQKEALTGEYSGPVEYGNEGKREQSRLADKKRQEEQTKALAEFGKKYATQVQKTAEEIKIWRERLGAAFTPEIQSKIEAQFKTATPKGSKAGSSAESEASRYLESLQKQLQATRDLSVEETLLADIQAGRLGKVNESQHIALQDAARQIDDARALLDFEKEFESARIDTARATVRAREEQEALVKSMLDATPTAQLERQRYEMQLLADEFNRGKITAEEFGEAASTRLGNVAEKQKEANESAKAFGDIMTSAFEDAILESKKFGDVIRALGKDLLKIFLRKQVTEPLAQAGGNFLDGLFGGLFGGGTPKAPNSGGGPFLNSLLSFEGGGWTGDGPRSGGLDGKGGYLAMVHPKERITDTTMGGGGGVVINQNINIDARGADAGVDAKIQQAMKQTKAETLAAVQSKANRGGGFAASVGRA